MNMIGDGALAGLALELLGMIEPSSLSELDRNRLRQAERLLNLLAGKTDIRDVLVGPWERVE
jgi:hypothetical protein